jgi:hypothetical protein
MVLGWEPTNRRRIGSRCSCSFCGRIRNYGDYLRKGGNPNSQSPDGVSIVEQVSLVHAMLACQNQNTRLTRTETNMTKKESVKLSDYDSNLTDHRHREKKKRSKMRMLLSMDPRLLGELHGLRTRLSWTTSSFPPTACLHSACMHVRPLHQRPVQQDPYHSTHHPTKSNRILIRHFQQLPLTFPDTPT